MPSWERLAPALASGRLGHALLFVGPPGVGKRLLADTLARALLCRETDAQGFPCGGCRSCTQMAAGSHPDYIELAPGEDSREIKVAQTREFSRRLRLTAHYGRRVGLIVPPEALNASAANSLLKSLEEPPAGVHVLLVSERPSVVLATIRSRCQRVRVPLPDAAATRTWAEEQGIGEALALARGAPLRAEALAAAGIGERQSRWRDDLAALAAGGETPLTVAERWHKEPPGELLDWLYLTVSDLLKHACGIDSSRWVQSAHAQRLISVAKSMDGARLRRVVPAIVEARRLLDSNVDRQLLWESLAIELWICRQRRRGNAA
jgi:DNA polymerase-3 subunit delta'